MHTYTYTCTHINILPNTHKYAGTHTDVYASHFNTNTQVYIHMHAYTCTPTQTATLVLLACFSQPAHVLVGQVRVVGATSWYLVLMACLPAH